MIARYRPYDEFTGNVVRARARFLRQFGFSHEDKTQVDKEIVELYESARENRADKVCIPLELVLALKLREGFARQFHRPAKAGSWQERRLESAIRNAWVLLRHYRAQGLRAGQARDRAIKEAAAADGVNESIVSDQMGRKARSHLRSMGPTHRMEFLVRPSRRS